MDPLPLDLSQILSNVPVAGAMIWLTYHITKESRKERIEHYKSGEEERRQWAEERKEIYEKIMKNLVDQNEYIRNNTKTLQELVKKKCKIRK